MINRWPGVSPRSLIVFYLPVMIQILINIPTDIVMVLSYNCNVYMIMDDFSQCLETQILVFFADSELMR